ncbi:hypothetical protein SDC9_127528 [bioreactor metagenome]|uniref:Uncharacterized protein n=1 Tax=bioreactor metagenome TaxID=1076179 RepID=A0A645CUA0_9ZZZZ
MQLGEHIPPLTHPQPRQEMFLAPGLLFAAGLMALYLIPCLPGMQIPQELRALILLSATETGVSLISSSLTLLRTITRILYRQRRSNHQHLSQTPTIARSQDHAAHPRIQRQLGQFAADRREHSRLIVADRPKLRQQRIPVTDQTRARRIDEGEILNRTQTQRFHPQDHAGQRGTQNFRIGMRRPSIEIVFVVQPDADAVHHPTAPSGTLHGRRPGNFLDLQLFDFVAW